MFSDMNNSEMFISRILEKNSMEVCRIARILMTSLVKSSEIVIT